MVDHQRGKSKNRGGRERNGGTGTATARRPIPCSHGNAVVARIRRWRVSNGAGQSVLVRADTADLAVEVAAERIDGALTVERVEG